MENSGKPVSEMSMADFLGDHIEPCKNQYQGNNDKARKYRKQMEFGAKKYIKP
jgi:hypothetical protein